jgi:hypothetical protein
VLIVDGNHRFKDPTVPVMQQGYDFRPITIGAETLITHGAVVTAPIVGPFLETPPVALTTQLEDNLIAPWHWMQALVRVMHDVKEERYAARRPRSSWSSKSSGFR